ncbi:glycoside hydrolase family 3 C-terminal domain-containing protein [Phenylobacterium sp. LjRoot219]|uniref:beta-glucosidase family protein n=1 Tax=Phenylobacterium sp. LjRoot219 TaxID=3342283 RepID=UPI003ED08E9C
MTQDEKLSMLQGFVPQTWPAGKFPANLVKGAGYVPGVPRLGIPPLTESDASLGVANMGGLMRAKDEATAMPAGLAMASTWSPELIEQVGRAMGAETRAKGFNVLLAGGINLVRDPRGGRAFEYFSEDPLLTGVLGGYSVRGIQSNRIVSTVKHYALNANETGRSFADVRMSEPAMRESDLLAFQIAIEVGQPGSVMCAYNKVNTVYACENSFLLNDVLRRDWGYKGWVMSDWGAVHSVSIRQGLDQESGTQPRHNPWFGERLKEALGTGDVAPADVDRSVSRILRTMYALGITNDPPIPGKPIDFAAHLELAQRVAEQGIVLLKNEGGLLPLAASAKRILVVGGHADKGVLAGAGSSQVWPVGGASHQMRYDDKAYHFRLYMPSAPLAALKAQYPEATVSFDDGTDPARAAGAARSADVVVVFAEQFRYEGRDVLSLNLPDNQDRLIEAVAAANRRTIVVLETGGPVAMPWIDRVPAVLQAWYPGNRGGQAIARVLSGAVNPSGRLPVTFPVSTAQIPNPVLPGQNLIDAAKGKDVRTLPKEQQVLPVEFPEGSDVGYRWYARKGLKPLFPFGHGLSYTTFKTSPLKFSGTTATFTVRNTGKRAGADVSQLYLVSQAGQVKRRLVGFQRVQLAAGETKQVVLNIDPRLLADWKNSGWHMRAGRYRFALGESADRLGPAVEINLPERSWRESGAPAS